MLIKGIYVSNLVHFEGKAWIISTGNVVNGDYPALMNNEAHLIIEYKMADKINNY